MTLFLIFTVSEKNTCLFNLVLQNVISEKEEDKKAKRGTEFVFTAKRGDGMLGAHMHRRMHECGVI